MKDSKTVFVINDAKGDLAILTHPAGCIRTELVLLPHGHIHGHMKGSGILGTFNTWHSCLLGQRDSGVKRVPGYSASRFLAAQEQAGNVQSKVPEGHWLGL